MDLSGSDDGDDRRAAAWLVCRADVRRFALPLAAVIETMRPLPAEPFGAMPPAVTGLAIIRGTPVPVVDAARLLGEAGGPCRRLVTVAVAGRTVALAVGDVLGIRPFAADQAGALPPLLREAAGDAVGAIGVLDSELLLVLREARLVPDTLFEAVAQAGAAG